MPRPVNGSIAKASSLPGLRARHDRGGGDAVVEGARLACAGCHRRSGLRRRRRAGGFVPPVTAPELFTASRRASAGEPFSPLSRKTSADALARLRSPAPRPPYTAGDPRHRAARRPGSTGRALDPLMPRYRPRRAGIAALDRLSRDPRRGAGPGGRRRGIHFATLFAPGSRPAAGGRPRRPGSLFPHEERRPPSAGASGPGVAVVQGRSRPARRAPGRFTSGTSPVPRKAGENSSRPLLPGAAGLRGARSWRPVGDWTPVHDFCEARRDPVPFPRDRSAGAGTPGAYSFIFPRA